MLQYLEDLKKALEALTVSGQKNLAILFDALRSLDVVIDTLRNLPEVEETTAKQTIELPVDPRLTGGESHASNQ